MSEKTELQRAILITAYQNPDATQAEIADACGCSRSYVSEVLRRYDGQDAMEAQIEEWNRSLGFDSTAGLGGSWDQSLGDGFDSRPVQGSQPVTESDADLAAAIEEGIHGLTVLLPWTEAADEDMGIGEAIVSAAILFFILGVIGYTVWLLMT